MTRRGIDAAVRAGVLIRARRDRYLPADAPDVVIRAVRVGGRLTCLSLLELLGVFVVGNRRLHVHLSATDGRMRSPHDRRRRLDLRRVHGTRLHWSVLRESPGARTCTDIVDALAHAVRCQEPRAAIASLDSALNLGLLDEPALGDVFALLPARYQVLRPLVDGRAQSGIETLVRLMLLGLGCGIDLQVAFDGVGFVDILADGWLVIECDSKAHHSSWVEQLRDYRRDLALAAQGHLVLRLTAEDVLRRPEEVLAALRGVLAAHRD